MGEARRESSKVGMTRTWNVEARFVKDLLPNWGGKAAPILQQPKCWSSSLSTNAFHREEAQKPERVIRFVRHRRSNSRHRNQLQLDGTIIGNGNSNSIGNSNHINITSPGVSGAGAGSDAKSGGVTIMDKAFGSSIPTHAFMSSVTPNSQLNKRIIPGTGKTTILKAQGIQKKSATQPADGTKIGVPWQEVGATCPHKSGTRHAASSLNTHRVEICERSPAVFQRLFHGRSCSGRTKKNKGIRTDVFRRGRQIEDTSNGVDQKKIVSLTDDLVAGDLTGNTSSSFAVDDMLVCRPGWKKTLTEIRVRQKLLTLSADPIARADFFAMVQRDKIKARKRKRPRQYMGCKTKGTGRAENSEEEREDSRQDDVERDMLVENKWLNDSKDECVEYWRRIRELQTQIDSSKSDIDKINIFKRWPSPPSPNHSSAHRIRKAREQSLLLQKRSKDAAVQRRRDEMLRVEQIKMKQKEKNEMTWMVCLNRSERERVEKSRLRLATLVSFLSCSLKLRNAFEVKRQANLELVLTAKSAQMIQRSWKRTRALEHGRQYRCAIHNVRRFARVSILKRRMERKSEAAVILISFLTSETANFIKVMKNYRFRAVQVQRYWRSYAAISKSRVRAMVMMFDRVERARLEREHDIAEKETRIAAEELKEALEGLVTDCKPKDRKSSSSLSQPQGGGGGGRPDRRVSFVKLSDVGRTGSSLSRRPMPPKATIVGGGGSGHGSTSSMYRSSRRSFIISGTMGLGSNNSSMKKQEKKSSLVDFSVPDKIPRAIKTALMASILRKRRLEFRDDWNAWKTRRGQSRVSVVFSVEQVRQSICTHRPSMVLSHLTTAVQKNMQVKQSLVKSGQRKRNKLRNCSLAEMPILYVYTNFTRQSLEDLVDVARARMHQNMSKVHLNDSDSDDEEEKTSEMDIQGMDDSTFITTMKTSFRKRHVGSMHELGELLESEENKATDD